MTIQQRLVCAAAGILLAAISARAAAPDFCVAPDGSDRNPGTMEKPFATLGRARDAVRGRIAAGLKADVNVLVRGGRYELAEPLVLGPEDSGTGSFAVTYAAQSGEQPVFSGGRRITGWKKDGNLWTAQVPAGTSFRQLFAGGQRLPRARHPKQGFLTLQEVSEDLRRFGFAQPVSFGPLAGRDAELVVLENWSVSRALVATSDARSVTTATPVGWVGHAACSASRGKPAFLEHAPEFLSQPGEWYLDRSRGVLALVGDDPEQREHIAPMLEQLIRVAGRKDAPVRNLRFVGLAFEHTEFPLPAAGYSEIQAAHYGPSKHAPTHVQPVAIEFDFAEHCRVEGCRVAHVGASGIGFGPGCRGNRVTGCELVDIGGNGVLVGWRGRGDLTPGQAEGLASLDADWQDPADAPAGNEIANNRIQRCGATSFGAVGVWVGFSCDTRVAHNEISDLPYTGISIGYRWNTTETTQKRCLVEFNHIHGVMKMLADGGGIYTLGFQPGTVLRGNLIHDVFRTAYAHGGAPNNGFFLDEGSKGFLIEDNIIYQAHGGPVRHNQNQPAWHTWTNNHFGAKPDAPGFPKELAAKAGLEAPYRSLLTAEK